MHRSELKGRGTLFTVLLTVLAFVLSGTIMAATDDPEPQAIAAYSAPALDHELTQRAAQRQQMTLLTKRLDSLTIQVTRAQASVKATEAKKAKNLATIKAQQKKAATLNAQVRELRRQTAVLNSQIARLEKTLSRLRARLAVQQAAAARAARPAAPVTGSQTVAAFKAYARARVGDYQFQFLDRLWIKESGWNRFADNPTSDAYGIPQSLPGSKMASAGADWQWNGYTQIRWGLSYIAERYGTCEAAWNHSVATNWY